MRSLAMPRAVAFPVQNGGRRENTRERERERGYERARAQRDEMPSINLLMENADAHAGYKDPHKPHNMDKYGAHSTEHGGGTHKSVHRHTCYINKQTYM